MNDNFKNIYFIGIGGISMSGLSELMLYENCSVSGSDKNDSHIIKKLKSMGAKIFHTHEASNITDDIDLVVYTSAIANDNPELLRAMELNLNIMDRAEFLGYIMKRYNDSICVSGTHGKTTTTGMLSSILLETDLDPTVFLGGEMDSLGGNLKRGANKVLVTEACEYKRNFLKFNPTVELILNIEEDHLDYYKDLADIKCAFHEYAQKLPSSGALIVNVNNAYLFKDLKCNIFTFGMDDTADFYPANINNLPVPSYSLMHNGKKITDVILQVFGIHNILNSIASAATCLFFEIDPIIISRGLYNFRGTHRRYQVMGTYKGATIIDDYAHHPTEMKTTLETARAYSPNKIITVFQPHTYTRTKSLLDHFANVLKLSDITILLDIYASRETDTGSVHSLDLLNKMSEIGANGVYAESFECAFEILDNVVGEGDTLITMGAGNVNELIPLMLQELAFG